MTLRLLALLAVAVISAVLPTAAPAQDNVLNVGKYGQLATYDPHAGGLDSIWWTLNNFYESLVDLNDDINGLRPVLATERIDPFVAGNGKQPGRGRCALGLETGRPAPDHDHGFLHQFLGKGEIASLPHEIGFKPGGEQAE